MYRTPEQIKRATMHATNKAFDRYFQIELEDLREVYADTKMAAKKGPSMQRQVIDFSVK
jgi:hypothetical protein